MVIFCNKWKKYNEIQLTKSNGLKYSKNYKSSTLPRDRVKSQSITIIMNICSIMLVLDGKTKMKLSKE